MFDYLRFARYSEAAAFLVLSRRFRLSKGLGQNSFVSMVPPEKPSAASEPADNLFA